MLRTVPYRFTPEVVRDVVARNKPGIYILGNDANGFVGGYVGRSDVCLQTRLTNHNHLFKFDYFIFRYAVNAQQAFRWECQYWHLYEDGMNICNCIHPASPRSSGASCPYCEFACSAAMLLAA